MCHLQKETLNHFLQKQKPKLFFFFFFYFFPPKLVSCSSLTSVELRAVSWFYSSNTDAIIICAEEGMKVSLKSMGGNRGWIWPKSRCEQHCPWGCFSQGTAGSIFSLAVWRRKKNLEACRTDLRTCRYNPIQDSCLINISWPNWCKAKGMQKKGQRKLRGLITPLQIHQLFTKRFMKN